MRQSSTERLEEAREQIAISEMRERAVLWPTQAFPDNGFALIAEVKPRSPSEGDLGLVSPVAQALSYQAGGASAISVLTEPTEFGGSLELLEKVAASVSIPVMRKDFIVDPYQIWEARAHGADGVLVIARMLQPDGLRALVDAAAEAELFALVEIFDLPDLDSIGMLIDADTRFLIGVNSRDLDTLQVRGVVHHRLAPFLPSGVMAIAESGVETVEDVRALSRLGYEGVLVGTSLMRSDEPDNSVREMIKAAVRA